MATSVSAMFIIAEPRSHSTEKIAAEIEQLVLRLEELEATPAAEAVGARGASPTRWAWPPAVARLSAAHGDRAPSSAGLPGVRRRDTFR